MNQPETIHDGAWICEQVDRIADRILSEFGDSPEELRIIGIQKRGVPLAARISARIAERTHHQVPVGKLDISMYRDDIGLRKALPLIHETDIRFDLEDRVLILTDDVLQAGRTIRAALDAVTDFGRPAVTRLAVLIDRGGHEFPIAPDYCGEEYRTDDPRLIRVRWKETDNFDSVEFDPNSQEKK